MADAQFDEYSRSYRDEIRKSIASVSSNEELFWRIKADAILEACRRFLKAPQDCHALDFGCGPGIMDSVLGPCFGSLHGSDISRECLAEAKNTNPWATYVEQQPNQLPFSDKTFDVVFAVNVMHHIPPANWQENVLEMRRVLKPGGLLMIFEHNPYNPVTQKVVRDCVFDQDAVLLRPKDTRKLLRTAAMTIVQQAYIVFFPMDGAMFRKIEGSLGWLPLGAQYQMIARK